MKQRLSNGDRSETKVPLTRRFAFPRQGELPGHHHELWK